MARTDEGGAGEVLRTGENPIKFLPNQNLSKTNLKYLSRKIQTSETPSDCRLGKSGNCTCRWDLITFGNYSLNTFFLLKTILRTIILETIPSTPIFSKLFFGKTNWAWKLISDLCWWRFSCCRCTRAGRPGTTMRRPRKLQIITLQVSHCFFKVSYLLSFSPQYLFQKRFIFLCAEKEAKTREGPGQWRWGLQSFSQSTKGRSNKNGKKKSTFRYKTL